MKRIANLYLDELQPSREWLTLTRFLKTSAVLLVVFLLMWVVINYINAQQQRESEQARAQLAAAQAVEREAHAQQRRVRDERRGAAYLRVGVEGGGRARRGGADARTLAHLPRRAAAPPLTWARGVLGSRSRPAWRTPCRPRTPRRPSAPAPT